MRSTFRPCLVFFLALFYASNSQDITVKEGESLTLPCPAHNLGGGSILWKKNDELIALDEDVLTSEGGYAVMLEGSNSSLIISRIEPINSANYSCEQTDPVKDLPHLIKNYRVRVNAPPVIVISPDHAVYNLRVGEKNVVLQCYVKEGNPPPTVQWARQDGQFPNDIKREGKGAKLVIPVASKSHSGNYYCEATNVAGSCRVGVEILVDDSDTDGPGQQPWVKNEVSFIPVRKNADVNLSCTYDGTPVPQVEWFFNGYKLNIAEERFKKTVEFAQRMNGYSKTTLVIKEINVEAFGDYACRISNKLGSVKAVVHVSGKPGPPELSVDGPELSWKVESEEKVLEYRFCYRFEREDTWQDEKCKSIRTTKSDNKGGNKWEHDIDLTRYLEPKQKYEIQLQARNAMGWGSYAKDYLNVEIQSFEQAKIQSAATLTTSLTLVIPALLLVF
ncbi:unnamed protein product [Caenorhabditis auriculariae]|uniref:Ig-like domain-containing protein n=1 Tax=Caenorhabditis auriculariae TaxID=2777116 RepID=A0A8S1H2L6_9PELO|nr:unnamed protein product [Caenorhabditis auriculariae]